MTAGWRPLPHCRNASNPYHVCSEYCCKVIAKAEIEKSQDSTASTRMTKMNGWRVLPDCRNASNPCHVCSEYCSKVIAKERIEKSHDRVIPANVKSSSVAVPNKSEDAQKEMDDLKDHHSYDKGNPEEEHTQVDLTNLTGSQKRLDLGLKMNEARKANRIALVLAEKKKTENPAESRGIYKEKQTEVRKIKIENGLETETEVKEPRRAEVQDKSRRRYVAMVLNPPTSPSTPLFIPQGFERLLRLGMRVVQNPNVQEGYDIPLSHEEQENIADAKLAPVKIPRMREILKGVVIRKENLPLLLKLRISRPETFARALELTTIGRAWVLDKVAALLKSLQERTLETISATDATNFLNELSVIENYPNNSLDIKWLRCRLESIRNDFLMNEKLPTFNLAAGRMAASLIRLEEVRKLYDAEVKVYEEACVEMELLGKELEEMNQRFEQLDPADPLAQGLID